MHGMNLWGSASLLRDGDVPILFFVYIKRWHDQRHVFVGRSGVLRWEGIGYHDHIIYIIAEI